MLVALQTLHGNIIDVLSWSHRRHPNRYISIHDIAARIRLQGVTRDYIGVAAKRLAEHRPDLIKMRVIRDKLHYRLLQAPKAKDSLMQQIVAQEPPRPSPARTATPPYTLQSDAVDESYGDSSSDDEASDIKRELCMLLGAYVTTLTSKSPNADFAKARRLFMLAKHPDRNGDEHVSVVQRVNDLYTNLLSI